ncbi:putative nesprin-1 [Apostichopus japonicus]|uniref:Putative nesprin-1 n=1 Tax=Stichopus japonicus TaxID=307972 RepID=A0A2G8KR04_STIJA|nr:putative nesprin-1 [Apostichopus japonicus]
MKTSKLTRTRSSKHYKMHNSLFANTHRPCHLKTRTESLKSSLSSGIDLTPSTSRASLEPTNSSLLRRIYPNWKRRWTFPGVAGKSREIPGRYHENQDSEAVAVRKQYNAMRNFTEDVIGHAADLKFVVKGGQKYLDSAKVNIRCTDKIYKSSVSLLFRDSLPDLSTKIRRQTSSMQLGDISKRFEQLKAQGTEQTNLLREVVEKQQRYGDLVDDMNNWLHDAESSLKNMQRDPVGTDPVTVRRQIDALKVLRDQVALHLKDIERMKDAGRNLADSKPDLQTDINRTNGGIVDRYNNLDTLINQRNQQLQSALTQSQDIQDSLESLIRWLDDTERTVHKMEKGQSSLSNEIHWWKTFKNRRQELLRKHMFEKLCRNSCSRGCTRAATEIMESSEPKLAKTLKNKVDGLKTRYDRLTTPPRTTVNSSKE